MTTTTTPAPYALAREEGEALWLMGSLSTIKASAESTGGALTLVEIEGVPGMAVPLHTHAAEEEFWYLLAGEVTFQLGERVMDATAGAFAFIPRGTPHGFHVRAEGTRFLDIRTPGGFDGFFRAVADPAPARELPPPPPPGPPDLSRLMEAAPRFGMTVVGPPPGVD